MCNKSKIRKRAADMASSLFTEGYIKTFCLMLPASVFYKLKHKQNGNVITIVGNYSKQQIVLRRNGRVRHTENIK